MVEHDRGRSRHGGVFTTGDELLVPGVDRGADGCREGGEGTIRGVRRVLGGDAAAVQGARALAGRRCWDSLDRDAGYCRSIPPNWPGGIK